jgi:hypothetical protein
VIVDPVAVDVGAVAVDVGVVAVDVGAVDEKMIYYNAIYNNDTLTINLIRITI